MVGGGGRLLLRRRYRPRPVQFGVSDGSVQKRISDKVNYKRTLVAVFWVHCFFLLLYIPS